jgi:flagellar hook-associated protein 1 FlgK
MGLLDTLRTGASGLAAASAGIDATAQNVANATTEGYQRRTVEQTTADPLRRGTLSIGQGVDVQNIVREGDALLGMQQLAQAGTASAAATLHDELSAVQTVFDETSASGPRSRLDKFFDAFSAATTDPSDPGLRSEVVRAGEDLAESIQQAAERLQQSQEAMEEAAAVKLPPLNVKLAEVASLNQRIVAAGGESEAADLVEQRERLMRELSEDAGFTARVEANGSATVMLDGHAVVTGPEARTLSVDGMSVQLSVDDGSVGVDVGGELGGFVQAHATVDTWLAELDTFAADFADAVNGQNAAGFTRSGAAGGDLFTYDPADPRNSFQFTASIDDLALASAATAHAGDGGNIDGFVALQSSSVVGGSTPGDHLSAITDRVGGDVASAASSADNEQLALGDLDLMASQRFGVDIDAEATQLMAYQTAYQAAARVMSSANEMLGTLMELV